MKYFAFYGALDESDGWEHLSGLFFHVKTNAPKLSEVIDSTFVRASCNIISSTEFFTFLVYPERGVDRALIIQVAEGYIDQLNTAERTKSVDRIKRLVIGLNVPDVPDKFWDDLARDIYKG